MSRHTRGLAVGGPLDGQMIEAGDGRCVLADTSRRNLLPSHFADRMHLPVIAEADTHVVRYVPITVIVADSGSTIFVPESSLENCEKILARLIGGYRVVQTERN